MTGFVAAIPLIAKVIDRLFPDKAEAAEQKLKLFEIQQSGDLAELDAETKIVLGQLAVNEAEAKSGSWWVAGWRPGVGWVCVVSVAWTFIIHPTVTWFGVDSPPIDVSQLMILLLGMLGIGGMRSFDKLNKTDTKKISG